VLEKGANHSRKISKEKPCTETNTYFLNTARMADFEAKAENTGLVSKHNVNGGFQVSERTFTKQADCKGYQVRQQYGNRLVVKVITMHTFGRHTILSLKARRKNRF